MKIPRIRLLLAPLCLNLLSLPLAATPAKDEVIIDFTDIRHDRFENRTYKNYEYAFQDWDKHVKDLPQRGALVQAATGKGGLGENKTSVKFTKYSAVELVFVIGNANTAQSINFSLEDSDGTEHSWNIPFAGRGKGIEYRFRIDLEKPSSTAKPGKTPGLNLKKIGTWQIKGDYSAPNVEVLLIKLVAAK